MSDSDSTNKVYFEVDSRLLFQLGEQLVSNRAIALAELVKNAYDADATEAIVILENVKNRTGGTITIKDNGIGIPPDRFQQTWMRIATIDSDKNPYSKKYNRVRAGEKGIGRIACKKLAKELHITSISETNAGDKVKLIAYFDWDSFYPGSNIDKVPIDVNIVKANPDEHTGTELKLVNTTEKWNEKNIKRLNFELINLFSPTLFKDEYKGKYSIKDDPGFKYSIIAPEFKIDADSVNESFLKFAWAKLLGHVDEFGHSTYILEVQNPLLNKFIKEFKKEGSFQYLKNTSLEIYLFKYTSYFFRNSDWKYTQAALIGRERGGVRIYADSFRVFGYGGEQDDWLQLGTDKNRSIGTFSENILPVTSEDSRPALQLFDYRGLFGYVQYDKRTNKEISISINRESIEGNEAFNELFDFVRTGINIATVVYSDERLKKERKDIEEEMKEEEEIRKKEEEEKRKAKEVKKKAEQERKKAEQERKKAEEIARKKEKEKFEAEKNRIQIEEELESLWDRITVIEKKNETLLPEEILELERLRHLLQEIRSNLFLAREKEREAIEEAHIEASKAAKAALEELEIKIRSFEEYKEAEKKIIETEKSEVLRQKKKYDEELSILRVLASTGTLIFIFTHEIRSFIADILTLKNTFASALEKMNDHDKKIYLISLREFGNKIEMVDELGKFIGLTGGNQSRSELQPFFIKQVVDDISLPFSYETQRRGITVINNIPQYLRTPVMYRSELASILINIFTNAVKAVTQSNERIIQFDGSEYENNVISIRCLDTGPGLKKDLWINVFDPFVSFNEPDINFGAGTGLGLKIVKDIVLGYGGNVKFTEPPKGWNTCIEITLSLVD